MSMHAVAGQAAIGSPLDFVLALEIFENEFYKAVLGSSTSAAQNAAFAPVRVLLVAVPGANATIGQIQKHEAAHVSTLLAAGVTNVFGLSAASFDFTGNRNAAGGGPFAKAMTDVGFLLQLAQGIEDTGVRAYKGQLTALATSSTLEAALRIHSVEARHASRIRRMRRFFANAPSVVRLSGTVRGGDAAAAGVDAGTNAALTAMFDRIYGAGSNAASSPSESNTTQNGVDVANLVDAPVGPEAAQEAFDEPLDRADVVAILQPFFIPTIS